MPVYFFDTSALVKRYAVEQGSDWVQAVANNSGNDIYIASITTVEVVSAVTRKLLGGHLSQGDADHVFRWFDAHCKNEYSVVPLQDEDLARARTLASTHGLRAYDAVQLSVCVALQQLRTEHDGPPISFVSSDKQLNNVADVEGLIIVNPEDEKG